MTVYKKGCIVWSVHSSLNDDSDDDDDECSVVCIYTVYKVGGF